MSKLLYEGKAKKLFATKDKYVLRQVFKDDATAFNALKKSQFSGKGQLNCAISTALFAVVEKAGVKTHLIEQTGPIEMLVRKVEIVKLEVIVRFKVAGSLQKRTGLPEGYEAKPPVVEFCYKDDALGDPIFNDDHIRLLKVAKPAEVEKIRGMAIAAAVALRKHFKKNKIELVDIKFEFGRDAKTGKILLADEISPDTMRVWSASGEKLDKDRFRFDLGDLVEGYRKVANALGVK